VPTQVPQPFLIFSCDISGKKAFIAGVADDNGYGWAIAKALAAAGAEILVGTWVPVCLSDPCCVTSYCKLLFIN
jgi:hypothetical protein